MARRQWVITFNTFREKECNVKVMVAKDARENMHQASGEGVRG